jgi:hypothetical protein
VRAHLEVKVHNVVAVVSDIRLVAFHTQLGLAAGYLWQVCQPDV